MAVFGTNRLTLVHATGIQSTVHVFSCSMHSSRCCLILADNFHHLNISIALTWNLPLTRRLDHWIHHDRPVDRGLPSPSLPGGPERTT